LVASQCTVTGCDPWEYAELCQHGKDAEEGKDKTNLARVHAETAAEAQWEIDVAVLDWEMHEDREELIIGNHVESKYEICQQTEV
jgi:hypothetical protein